MRRKIIAEISLTLLLTSLLPLMCDVVTVKATGGTICIRPDGSVDPSTAPIQRNGDNYTFTDNIYDSIVVQRDNITIDGNGYTLQGAGSGTGFDFSNRDNITIKKTRIIEWNYGVHLYNNSIGNTIINNNLTHNIQRGIFISNSSSNTISGNNIVNNNRQGIFLWLTNTTTVADNNVSNNGEDGISIGYSSFNNTVISNAISSNSWAGISLGFETLPPTANLIVGNNITDNLWAGIFTDHVQDNAFYHNNLKNNTNQVITVGATNTWDESYPSGGNYWSDYNGTDLYSGLYQNETGNDGIGDTPYIIDTDNQDNYPLLTPLTINIVIINVTANTTETYQVEPVNITVTITNNGTTPQTFNVTAYYDDNSIGTQTLTNIAPDTQTTITFNWNTTLVPPYKFITPHVYTIKAEATHVEGETNLNDNTYTDGTVKIKIPGDINGDGIVDAVDLATVAVAYGEFSWMPEYNPDADLTKDGIIDARDLATVTLHYGEGFS